LKDFDFSQRQYAGASHNRLTADWQASSSSADTEIHGSIRALRNRARQLCRDFSYANGAIRNLALRIVGDRVSLQSQLSQMRGGKLNAPLNSRIEKLFINWGRTCDVRGIHTFQDILYICALTVLRDGEIFIRLVKKKSSRRSPISLQLELIEADQCPEWLNSNNVGAAGRGFVRMGIEYDEWRSPSRYAFLPYHPGDSFLGYSNGNSSRIIWSPAEEIIHLYFPDRVGQSRGVTALASMANELRQLFGYQEAELIKARGQSAISGIITTEDVAIEGEKQESNFLELEPGAVQRLLPGEEFVGFNPSAPNPVYPDFVKQSLKSQAVGIGLSYPTYSADPSEANYSSSRLSSIDNLPLYKRFQTKFGDILLTPIYEAWLERAVLANVINIPNYFNPDFYPEHYWQFPGQPFIDPQGELQATQLSLELGLTTLTEEIAKRGGDIDDVIATRIAETEKLQKVKEAEQKVQEAVDKLNAPAPAQGLTSVRFFEIADRHGLSPIVQGFAQRAVKAKKCVKGFSCGNSCQVKSKVCRLNLSPDQQKRYQQLSKKLKSKGGISATQQEELATLKKESKKTEHKEKTPSSEYVAQDFNPHAIKDLSPEDFQTFFYKDRPRLQFQDDPSSLHNMSFEEAKAAGLVRVKSEFTSSIKRQIENGFVPSEKALKDTKLKKDEQAKLGQNRKDLAEFRAKTEKIEKAINHPVMTEEEKRGYSPTLSQKDASDYVANSFLSQASFFHGTDAQSSRSIANEGSDPDRNSTGWHGKGMYFAMESKTAELYAYTKTSANRETLAILEFRTKVKNPYIIKDDELGKLISFFPGDEGNSTNPTALTEYYRAKGHDSFYYQKEGHLITFQKEQVVTIKKTEIAADSPEGKKIYEFWGKEGFKHATAEAEKVPAFQALAKIPSQSIKKAYDINENPNGIGAVY
jgi:lambda family phage portal protein